MSVVIARHYTHRSYQWTDWKTVESAKGGQYQFDDDGTVYTIWFYDGPEVHVCTIWKGTVPDGVIGGGYTQTQNDSDKSDFETNFKPTANTILQPKAADGRVDVRMTAANKAKNFNLKVFSFTPGDVTSLVNMDPTYANLSDVTMTCYTAGGATTTNAATAVKTVLDWEPTYNYEVIGGWVDVPPSIVGGAAKTWYVSVMGVPDISAGLGGSIPFVFPTDLALVYTNKIVSDGRASVYLTYNATYHTNKLRWIFKHPTNAGGLFSSATPAFQVYVETFQ